MLKSEVTLKSLKASEFGSLPFQFMWLDYSAGICGRTDISENRTNIRVYTFVYKNECDRVTYTEADFM